MDIEMDAAGEKAIPQSAYVAETGEGESGASAETRFDTGLAARYSVANFGSSLVYGLLNTGMPLYLERYGVAPWLIGLLANERAFVGALVQPFVGRMSDRFRSPLGRRRPFFLVGVPLMSLTLLLLAGHPDFWLMIAIVRLPRP